MSSDSLKVFDELSIMPTHYLRMERLIAQLDLGIETSDSVANEVLFSIARAYAGLQGWDADDLFSQLSDPKFFWDAQYSDPSGKTPGMDIMDAFRCLVDTHRTKTLIKGITEVADHKKRLGIVEPIAIDAGTGTGILALALLAAGCGKVYALEINEQTASAAAKLIDSYGLSHRIEVVQGDATQIQLPGVAADILVSENLSNGLFDEPQYRIINHLSSYLKPDATIIPAAAEVMVALGYTGWAGIEKTWSNVRKLPDLVRLTSPARCTMVDSYVGMPVPRISGEVEINYPLNAVVANALVFSTRFKITDNIYLEPDSAEFLGKSAAFKLGGELTPGKPVTVKVSYPTEMRKQYAKVSLSGNIVTMLPSEEYGA